MGKLNRRTNLSEIEWKRAWNRATKTPVRWIEKDNMIVFNTAGMPQHILHRDDFFRIFTTKEEKNDD